MAGDTDIRLLLWFTMWATLKTSYFAVSPVMFSYALHMNTNLKFITDAKGPKRSSFFVISLKTLCYKLVQLFTQTSHLSTRARIVTQGNLNNSMPKNIKKRYRENQNS